mmetsp:Transcript_11243/g.37519  ORF Transcript_11243/g.37519 Transcript_11243/m.37519 type:complete len:178 (+) Transcript_11243:92-625(+)
MSIFLPPSLDRAARGKKKSFAPAVQPIRTVAEVADVAKVADPLVVLPRRARDGPPAPQKRGRVRVAYSIYKNEYATVDGILDFSQMDDDFYISFVFEGDFTTRLVAVSGGVVLESEAKGSRARFSGAVDGAEYKLEVDESAAVSRAAAPLRIYSRGDKSSLSAHMDYRPEAPMTTAR